LTYDLEILWVSGGCEDMLLQNFIEVSAAVHELSAVT